MANIVDLWLITKTQEIVMDIKCSELSEIAPNLIKRFGGGWLAISPKGDFLSIGVTAKTEEEARQKFGLAYKKWVEILESKA